MKHLFLNRIFLVLLFGLVSHAANAEDPILTFTYAGQELETSDASPKKGTITVSEGIGFVRLTATLSEIRPHDVTFTFNHLFGSADINNDFNFDGVTEFNNKTGRFNSGANITIPTGETSIEFPIVKIRNDRLYENLNALNLKHNELEKLDETLIFTLSSKKGLALSHTTLTLKIEDDDDVPTIALSSSELFPLIRNDEGSYNVSINESDGGIPLVLSVRNTTSEYPIEIGYVFTQGAGINIDPEQPDYNDPGEGVAPHRTGVFVIPPKVLSHNFSIFIQDDVSREETETFTFTLSTPINATIHPNRHSITIAIVDNDASTGVINDTGVSTCYNDKADVIDCETYPTEVFPIQNQDGSDHQPNQFVHLSHRGERITDASDEPICVYDEKTNLIWENNKNAYIYTWYNTMANINGGNDGFEGSSGTNARKCGTLDLCNTQKYSTILNKLPSETDESVRGLCNMQNWRLPKLSELLSIMDFEPDNTPVLINENFNTFNGTYWTATPVVISADYAWCVYFGIKNNTDNEDKHIRQCKKNGDGNDGYFVRMVATCMPNENEPNHPC